jgi:hypothetical protein
VLASSNGSEAVEDAFAFDLYQVQLDVLSNGMPLHLEQVNKFEPEKRKTWRDVIDFESGVLPFLSFQVANSSNEMEAERNLDVFTQEALITLCIKTNTVVICTTTKACSLGMP